MTVHNGKKKKDITCKRKKHERTNNIMFFIYEVSRAAGVTKSFNNTIGGRHTRCMGNINRRWHRKFRVVRVSTRRQRMTETGVCGRLDQPGNK